MGIKRRNELLISSSSFLFSRLLLSSSSLFFFHLLLYSFCYCSPGFTSTPPFTTTLHSPSKKGRNTLDEQMMDSLLLICVKRDEKMRVKDKIRERERNTGSSCLHSSFRTFLSSSSSVFFFSVLQSPGIQFSFLPLLSLIEPFS